MANNKLIKQYFDLTTDQGIKNSFGFLASSPILSFLEVGFKIGLKSIFDSKRTETQAKLAEDLIKRGKVEGVDEMELTMDNSRGFKLKVPIDGIDVETKLGADEKMHVKVKYK